MKKSFWFPEPQDTYCELTPDPTGVTIVGQADTYTGPGGPRTGLSFLLPDGLLDQQGAQLVMQAKGYASPLIIRGTLFLNLPGRGVYLMVDDVHMIKGASVRPFHLDGRFCR